MQLGGNRPGAGRPPAESPAKHNVGARLNDKQLAKWLELGGSRWLKRLIDEACQKDA